MELIDRLCAALKSAHGNTEHEAWVGEAEDAYFMGDHGWCVEILSYLGY